MNLINQIHAANPHPKVRGVAQLIVSSLRNGGNVTLDVHRDVFNEIARITGNQVNTTWSWRWMAFVDEEERRVDIQYRDYLGDIAKPLKP
jgi:hypothetical protein